MFNILAHFEKYKHLKNPKDDITALSKLLSDELKIAISPECIKIQKEKVILEVSSVIKSHIYFKKEDLISKINEILPDRKIVDII